MKRHLISAADLSRDDTVLILDTAEEMARVADRPIKKLPTLRGRTVVNLFFEDSTRPRISFDAVVIRHGASGAPYRLANSGWIDAAVINAGDGTHQHPTQALLDAFTMRR